MDLGQKVRERRKAFGLSQEHLAHRAGVSLNAVHKLEAGRITDPHFSTLSGIAHALDTTVAELVGEEAAVPLAEASETGPPGRGTQPPASDAPEEQAAKSWSPTPKLQRFLAQRRRETLERYFQHLTLRTETLRDQAKKYYEAGDRKGLWPVLMDCFLLVSGVRYRLADAREEVRDIGGETKEERRLRDRLEHRIADLGDVGDQIQNMWKELLDADKDAEDEAPHKEIHPDAELLDLMPFLRDRAG
jgi:transcriptional regulator with XRE-family HTH domain